MKLLFENWRKFLLKEDPWELMSPGVIDKVIPKAPTEKEKKQEKEKREAYQMWYSSKINKMKNHYQELLDSDMKTWEAQAGTIEHFKKEDKEIEAIEKANPGWLEFHFMRDVAGGSVLSPPRSTSPYGDVSKSKLQKFQGEEYRTQIEKVGDFAEMIAKEAAVAAGVGLVVTTVSRILGLASKALSKTKVGKQMAKKSSASGRSPGDPARDAAIQKIKLSPKEPRYSFYYDHRRGPTWDAKRKGGKPVRKDRLDIAQEDEVFMSEITKALDPSYDYYIHKIRYAPKGQSRMDVQFSIKQKGFLKSKKRPTFGKISTAEEGLSSMEIAKRILQNRIYTNPGPKGQIGSPIDGRAAHITNVYRVPPGMRPEDFAKKLEKPVVKKLPAKGATQKTGEDRFDVVQFDYSVPFQPDGQKDIGVVAVIDATRENVHLVPRMVKRDTFPINQVKRVQQKVRALTLEPSKTK